MKKYITCAAILGIAVSICIFPKNKTDDATVLVAEGIEALSDGDNNDVDKLICQCSWYNDNSCAVDNWGSECASGKNVHCWEYNKNCS